MFQYHVRTHDIDTNTRSHTVLNIVLLYCYITYYLIINNNNIEIKKIATGSKVKPPLNMQMHS